METALKRRLRAGDRGDDVALVQEWLCLHDIRVKVHGELDAATEQGIRKFQAAAGLPADGIVGPQTFAALIAPMTRAGREIPAAGRPLGELVVAYAMQHLREHPREVGGDNRGPWVRLYMKGNDGPEWLWCAGLVCHLIERACHTFGVPLPVESTYSCDRLAQSAKANGCFVSGAEVRQGQMPRPGWIFLIRRTSDDWIHTGVVTAVRARGFETIEGNTNDEGSRNGYELCARVRGFQAMDFIRL